ncbi:MAG: hypothetical protein AAF903_06050 [Pseudomonadota bacterium]
MTYPSQQALASLQAGDSRKLLQSKLERLVVEFEATEDVTRRHQLISAMDGCAAETLDDLRAKARALGWIVDNHLATKRQLRRAFRQIVDDLEGVS